MGHSLANCKTDFRQTRLVLPFTCFRPVFVARQPETGSARESIGSEIYPGMRQAGNYSVVQEDNGVRDRCAFEKLLAYKRGRRRISMSLDHTPSALCPRRKEMSW
jgi:hypothetical protein